MLTARAPLRRVRLQLFRTERLAAGPRGLVIDAARPDPLSGDDDIELSFAGNGTGSITVGRVAEHEEPFAFDLSERPLEALHRRLGVLLGRPAPPMTSRWEAVLHTCTDGRLWYREAVDEGVTLITGAGEHGALLAPVIAEDTFDWFDGA
jgi:hypothetical protein